MTKPMFEKVALIGIGLIGSSLAQIIRRENLAGHIAISTRRTETLARAQQLGLGDSYHTAAEQAVQGADLVILCIPVGACGKVAQTIAPNLAKGAIISDVGSVKSSVIAEMAPHLPDHVAFVPAHPVAGTEQSGPDAGFADLFKNRWCILTPPGGVPEKEVNRLADFWRACGSNVEVMTASHHDLVLAITSHIPHLIAYNIVGTTADLEDVTKSEVIKYSAGGFRDFTRIAASDPVMWRDIFLNNKDAILEMLGRFSEDLSVLQRAIRNSDGEALETLFARTREIRRGIIEAGQEADTPDFGRPHGGPEEEDASS